MTTGSPFVVIQLIGAPRGKGRPRFSSAGAFVRVYTDAATKKFENALRAEGVKVMAGRPPVDEALSVSVVAHMAIPKSFSKAKRAAALGFDLFPMVKPDGDNFLKIALDALNGVVWRDDVIVVFSSILKVYSELPRIYVEVRKWND